MKINFILLIIMFVSPLHGANQNVGEHIGYLIREYFSEMDINYDDLCHGIKKYQEGKPPELTDEEFLPLFQELALKKSELELRETLSACEDFLQKIRNEEGVEKVVLNKLYVKNLRKSNKGKLLVDQGMFHITCTTVHGERLFDTRSKNSPVFQNLDQAIPGFVLGVKGMQEGDRRILYIHPSLAYNDAALIIDVELTKVLER